MTSTTSPPAELAHLSAPFSTAAESQVVVAPVSPGPGSWAGAPSALLHDGLIYLAYRLRRPIGQGRGFANVVARSSDGVHFVTIATLGKATFDAESLERPALAVTSDRTWRAYISAATRGTKHWRVDLVEAATPEGMAAATPRTILPGSADLAVKDPVIVQHGGRWHLWASCHPLDDPDATDRMTSEYASSDDGLVWTWHGTALRGRAGSWDARGTRVSAVRLDAADPIAYYDGRATAEENWEERTGVARIAGLGSFEAHRRRSGRQVSLRPGRVALRQRAPTARRRHPALLRGHPSRRRSRARHDARGAVIQRIRTAIPDVRIIALLRDPVDRAHSNWAHLWSAGLEPEHDFVAACRLEDRRAAAGWAPFWRYLSLGKYGEQLDHLWSLFPRRQTLVLRCRELRESPADTLDRITSFLGVAPGVVTGTTAENVTTHASPSPVNRAVAQALRFGSGVESWVPNPLARALGPANRFLSRHLQREQRVREPLTLEQRAALTRTSPRTCCSWRR